MKRTCSSRKSRSVSGSRNGHTVDQPHRVDGPHAMRGQLVIGRRLEQELGRERLELLAQPHLTAG